MSKQTPAPQPPTREQIAETVRSQSMRAREVTMSRNARESVLARLIGHGGIEPHNSVRPLPLTRQQIASAVSIAIQNEPKR